MSEPICILLTMCGLENIQDTFKITLHPTSSCFLKQLKMYNPVFLQPVINFLKHFRSYKFMGVTDDHFLFTVNAYNTHCLTSHRSLRPLS